MARPVSRAPCRAVQEVAILQALRGTTDPRERQRLQEEMIRIGEWMPRIRSLARRWSCKEVTLEEFTAAGLQGVLEAAARFDDRRRRGWATFATRWARRRIQELARAQQGPLVAETQWEQRCARRRGLDRRPSGWALVDAPSDDDDRGRYSEVCAATQDMQAAGEEQVQHAAMLAAIGAAAAELPARYRAALAVELGEAPTVKLGREERAHLRTKALRWLRRRVSK